jgi:hypothetical protein
MEIFGGFMVMMSIIGLFLAVIWLVMPFVVIAIKGKQDRTLEVLEGIEKRLAALEAELKKPSSGGISPGQAEQQMPVAARECGCQSENSIASREASC